MDNPQAVALLRESSALILNSLLTHWAGSSFRATALDPLLPSPLSESSRYKTVIDPIEIHVELIGERSVPPNSVGLVDERRKGPRTFEISESRLRPRPLLKGL